MARARSQVWLRSPAWRAKSSACRIFTLSKSAALKSRVKYSVISSPREFGRSSRNGSPSREFIFPQQCLKSPKRGKEVRVALLVAIVTFLIVGCVVFALWLTLGGGANQDVIQQRLEAVRKSER